jgi:hypothetical protein
MKGHRTVAGAVGAVAAALACVTNTSPSFAQDRTIVTQPAPPPPMMVAPPLSETTEAYTGPNRALIGTGLVTFGLAYIPAVVVAGQSTQSYDHHLYVPVVGPWLNLANRPACGPESIDCDTETTNKVLLGVDGVFQGIGAITTLAGFLTPEPARAVVTAKAKPSLHVTPAKVGRSGYGLAAFGEF